jgi:hypothetical protein
MRDCRSSTISTALFLGVSLLARPALAGDDSASFRPIEIPAWVNDVALMAFITPGDVERAARAGVQVVHANMVWPYYPLRRDGGGLSKDDADRLRAFTEACHAHHMKLILGLPPFPPVNLVADHRDWRVHGDNQQSILKVDPDENLGTRIGCNVGPWGNYLVDVLVELVEDFGLDGFSFDGNYHPPICFCPSCKNAFQNDMGRELPAAVDLDQGPYREYLVWRGEKLEEHYRTMQRRLKAVNPDTVVMSWTVNAGRYGHFLHSPRAMPTRLNLLFDLPMQEWWLDETNFGPSVAPAFGAAYVRATTGGRPNASEPYLMSRGNPYGTDSFPKHERITRVLLAMTNGSLAPESFGWPGHAESTADVFAEIARRRPWIQNATSIPWAALVVSEQTRQFYAYRDIANRYLPHLFGTFRTATEEHLPLDLINDWDLNAETLSKYRVVVLANTAAMSNDQCEAIRRFVQAGGGLVATGETSLFDQLGRPRRDFSLADLFGVSYRGRPKAPEARPELDANFAITVDENYWKERVGVATLTWTKHPLVSDARLDSLVPDSSAIFRGPQVAVTEPKDPAAVVVRMRPEGWTDPPLPAGIVHTHGAGRVVYLPAAIDAAMWSYAYPYQRRLLARAIEFAAAKPFPISVQAPMCVQAGYFEQRLSDRRRIVLHLFNGMNTTANHGLPATDVPLREETVPIHQITVRFEGQAPHSIRIEPGGASPVIRRQDDATVVELPPLQVHYLVVAE